MLNRGFIRLEIIIGVAILVVLGFIVFGGRANAEELDRRQPAFTTGVTVGPWIGANSWPHTGTGVPITLRHRSRVAFVTPGAVDFMDWRTLRDQRLDSALVAVLGSIIFPFDSDKVIERYSEQVSFVSGILAENPEISLFLVGHTDPVGTDKYNDGLGTRRAGAIKNALVASGIAESRFVVISHGESSPLRYGTAPATEQRRVEILPFRAY